MDPLRYQSGFGNQFASEAVPGALPQGRNSPQRAPHGLYYGVQPGAVTATAPAATAPAPATASPAAAGKAAALRAPG